MKLLQNAWNELVEAPWPVTFALLTLVLSGLLVFNYWESKEAVIIIIVSGNSLTQMCIDFFEGTSKKYFSALARLIPVIAAICAFLSLGK